MDYVGGLHGCYSVMQAIAHRKKDGKGRNIDLAQFESGVASLGALLLAGIVDGIRPPRMGNRSTSVAPQGCYACAGEDQWCVISIENDEQWRALAGLIDGAELAEDTRFHSLAGRMRHHDLIDERIEAWTRSRIPDHVQQNCRPSGCKRKACGG